MTTETTPACWRRDEDGNLYRLLTAPERAIVEAARQQQTEPADEAFPTDAPEPETEHL